MKAIILLSGGLDSTVMLAKAINDGLDCLAISFNYGQRNLLELRAAKNIAKFYNVPHKMIKIDPSIFKSSSLVSGLKVPKDSNLNTLEQDGIPKTYVPARNTIFLAYSLGQAENFDADEIHFGPALEDFHSYPDCRPKFIDAFQELVNVSTQQAVEGSPPKLITPFINMKKFEIINAGKELKAPLEQSLSCYDPTPLGEHCQKCLACKIRFQGFAMAES